MKNFVITLEGPQGCGKTTLAHSIETLIKSKFPANPKPLTVHLYDEGEEYEPGKRRAYHYPVRGKDVIIQCFQEEHVTQTIGKLATEIVHDMYIKELWKDEHCLSDIEQVKRVLTKYSHLLK